MTDHHVPSHMFGGEVRRVLSTQHFCVFEITGPQSILNPKIGHVSMSDLSQTATPADANGGGGIGQDLNSQLYTKIGSK